MECHLPEVEMRYPLAQDQPHAAVTDQSVTGGEEQHAPGWNAIAKQTRENTEALPHIFRER